MWTPIVLSRAVLLSDTGGHDDLGGQIAECRDDRVGPHMTGRRLTGYVDAATALHVKGRLIETAL